jgi:hypothetical protein
MKYLKYKLILNKEEKYFVYTPILIIIECVIIWLSIQISNYNLNTGYPNSSATYTPLAVPLIIINLGLLICIALIMDW